MPWSIVSFGKHRGKTLPQIIFSDPDWFFWAIEKGVFKNKGSLATEAQEVHKKATKIKIPNNDNDELVVEYIVHQPTGKFSQIADYDKLGCKQLLSSLKYYVFGNKSVRMTKKKCEDFFDTSNNFA